GPVWTGAGESAESVQEGAPLRARRTPPVLVLDRPTFSSTTALGAGSGRGLRGVSVADRGGSPVHEASANAANSRRSRPPRRRVGRGGAARTLDRGRGRTRHRALARAPAARRVDHPLRAAD